jgi:hypothetical protein
MTRTNFGSTHELGLFIVSPKCWNYCNRVKF